MSGRADAQSAIASEILGQPTKSQRMHDISLFQLTENLRNVSHDVAHVHVDV